MCAVLHTLCFPPHAAVWKRKCVWTINVETLFWLSISHCFPQPIKIEMLFWLEIIFLSLSLFLSLIYSFLLNYWKYSFGFGFGFRKAQMEVRYDFEVGAEDHTMEACWHAFISLDYNFLQQLNERIIDIVAVFTKANKGAWSFGACFLLLLLPHFSEKEWESERDKQKYKIKFNEMDHHHYE